MATADKMVSDGRNAAAAFMARFADYAASGQYAKKRARAARRDAMATIKLLSGCSRLARATRAIPGFMDAAIGIEKHARDVLATR